MILNIPRDTNNCGFYVESFLFFFFFGLFRAVHMAHGSSQARSQIRALAASRCHSHSHSNSESEPGQRPTPQLTAMPVP